MLQNGTRVHLNISISISNTTSMQYKDHPTISAAREHLKKHELQECTRLLLNSADGLCHRYFFEHVIPHHAVTYTDGIGYTSAFLYYVHLTPDEGLPNLQQFLDSIDIASPFQALVDIEYQYSVMHMMVVEQWDSDAAWAFADTFLRNWQEMTLYYTVDHKERTAPGLLLELPDVLVWYVAKFEAVCAKYMPASKTYNRIDSRVREQKLLDSLLA